MTVVVLVFVIKGLEIRLRDENYCVGKLGYVHYFYSEGEFLLFYSNVKILEFR